MTHTCVRGEPGAPDPAGGTVASSELMPTRLRRKLGVPALLLFSAMFGLGALCYPSAADWFATLGHNASISGYVRDVKELPAEAREDALDAARAYNAHLPAGLLRDPYTSDGKASDTQEDAAYRAYLDVLAVSDSGDGRRVIGEVSYPRLGIELPLFHGTSDEAISKGVGHLYGSSLPVGGPSTHSVLTSHSGLVNATLFTPLPKARTGDTFSVTVLGEERFYKVTSIETVEPFVTESLGVRAGEDRVTLITCSPIGINSHRLLVHGVRTDAPEGSAAGATIAGDGRTPGFPWWAVAFLGGSGAAAYLLFAPPRKRNSRGTSTAHHTTATNGTQETPA